MNIFTGFVVYLLSFWTILFAILPWGNKAPEVPEGGASGGAPYNPRIKQKFLVTAVISAIVWIIVAILIHYKIIDFRGIAKQMSQEDLAP